MTIIRRRYTKNFTTIDNVLFDDDRLAADEVGILAYLLSRPRDWEVRRPALQRRWGIGREAMKRIMFNWIRTGWCWPVRDRAPNGTTYVIYEIRDQPGPSLSDEDVRNALSLGSSEAGSGDVVTRDEPVEEVPETSTPPTGYPSLAEPSPVDPSLAYKDIPNKDLPRDESYQNSEREAVASRQRHALRLAEFKRRYPTAASDDQSKIDDAWFSLSEQEGTDALAGIPAFLAKLKADKRDRTPAGFTYLAQKRWTLLDQPEPASSGSQTFPRGSIEAKAVEMLHRLAGRTSAFRSIFLRSDGSVSFLKPMTDQLRALGQIESEIDSWPQLARNQAAAWEQFIGGWFVSGIVRHRLREGDRAPHPWPPKVDGTWSPAGAPASLMTEQDLKDLQDSKGLTF